jgi:hypothetical protein
MPLRALVEVAGAAAVRLVAPAPLATGVETGPGLGAGALTAIAPRLQAPNRRRRRPGAPDSQGIGRCDFDHSPQRKIGPWVCCRRARVCTRHPSNRGLKLQSDGGTSTIQSALQWVWRIGPRNQHLLEVSMRRACSLFSTVGALAALVGTTVASATVITFDGLGGNNGDAFTTYAESGYTVSKTSGSGCVGKAFGNPTPSVFGGPTCDNGVSGLFSLTGAGLFSFDAIDLAANNGDLDYTITGLLGGATVWTQVGSLAAGTGTFVTLASLSGAAVDTLTFDYTTRGTSWNFDNIGVTAASATVPEPGSVALVSLALLGLAALRRRRDA